MNQEIMIQFGEKVEEAHCILRPGAYAVIMDDNEQIAIVEDNGRFHLPGGGIHENENIDEALAREVLEETGLVFASKKYIGNANQYCYSPGNKKYYNKLCQYFLIGQFNEDPSIKNPEHKVAWMSPDDAQNRLEHESHIWAIRQAKNMNF